MFTVLNKMVIMEGLRGFLESSTIHGLAYLATASRKLVKLFWLIVVSAGFIGAGILIFKSFKDWNENPITTTIETLPIENVTFPKVTVCPPKNTFTNLNYDLMKTQNMTLDISSRNELTEYAVRLIRDNSFKEAMSNLSLMEEENRYLNWYNGYTIISPPLYTCSDPYCLGYALLYYIHTSAKSGTIRTPNFGEKFDPTIIAKNIIYIFTFHPPREVLMNQNITLHFKVKKNIIPGDILNENLADSITPPGPYHHFTVIRLRSVLDINDLDLHQIVGFELKWYYNENVVPYNIAEADDLLFPPPWEKECSPITPCGTRELKWNQHFKRYSVFLIPVLLDCEPKKLFFSDLQIWCT